MSDPTATDATGTADLRATEVVAGGVYALMLVTFQQVLRRAYDRVRVLVGESLAAMSGAISGLPTIRAYGAEDHTAGEADTVLDAQHEVEVRTQALRAGLFSRAELFAASVAAGVVAVGVAGPADMAAGQLVAFLFLVALFIEAVQLLVEVPNEAQSAAAAGLRRVLDVIETSEELEDPGDRGRTLPSGALSVDFRPIRFRYPTGQPRSATSTCAWSRGDAMPWSVRPDRGSRRWSSS